ncbi:MAG: hypothetical protein WCD07_00580 [Burkholderiales bacterium]
MNNFHTNKIFNRSGLLPNTAFKFTWPLLLAAAFFALANTPGHAAQPDAAKRANDDQAHQFMQIARGDNNRTSTSPRRTNNTTDGKTEKIKEEPKDNEGLQGPPGKTPDEMGPEGKTQPEPKGVFRLNKHNVDDCNFYLALYRQLARVKTVSGPCV